MVEDSGAPIRVLVADDDPLILKCYRRALTRGPVSAAAANLGSLSEELFNSTVKLFNPKAKSFNSTVKSTRQPTFEVVECSQGDEALAAAKAAIAEGEPFDVVILDVRMPPGMDGVAVGERIRHADPHVPIAFVTGYSDVSEQELASRVPPASRLHVYAKPFSFRALARDIVTMVRAA